MIQYLCIVTHPRSGATVIQRILNSMTDSTFRGENGGIIVDLCKIFEKVVELSGDHPYRLKMDPRLEKYPLYGVNLFKAEDIKKTLKKFFINEIIKPETGSTYIGWKENWLDPNVHGEKKVHNYLNIIQELFPDIKIIFNLRNSIDTAKSPGWFGRDSVEEIVNNYHTCYNNYLINSANNKNLIMINYDNWKGNAGFIYKTFTEFGLSVDISKIQKILNEDLVHLKNL